MEVKFCFRVNGKMFTLNISRLMLLLVQMYCILHR